MQGESSLKTVIYRCVTPCLMSALCVFECVRERARLPDLSKLRSIKKQKQNSIVLVGSQAAKSSRSNWFLQSEEEPDLIILILMSHSYFARLVFC